MMKLSRRNVGGGGGWGASAGGRGGRGVGNSKHKRGTLPGRLPSSSAEWHTMGSCSPHCPCAGGPACRSLHEALAAQLEAAEEAGQEHTQDISYTHDMSKL